MPVLVAAALLVPAPLDPLAPFERLPAVVWILLIAAAALPAAAVAAARIGVRDAADRDRALGEAGLAAALAAVAAALAAILVAPSVLARVGVPRAALLAAAAAVAAAGALAVARPASRRRRQTPGLLLVATVAVRVAVGEPASPEEILRSAMVAAPGWGPASLGSLAARAIARPLAAPRYRARLERIAAGLESRLADGSLTGPFADDARLLLAWLYRRIAAAPSIDDGARREALLRAISATARFADDPAASPEPFTLGGVLAIEARNLTEGLGVDPALRMRLAAAWDGFRLLVTEIDDPAEERAAIERVRRLFDEHRLDPTHPLHLATYSLERHRLLEREDAEAARAFLADLAAKPWPPAALQAIRRELDLLRRHEGPDLRAAVRLLRARDLREVDPSSAQAAYRSILAEFPESPVAATAREELDTP